MARRVVTRLSEEADERFLMLLTQLNKDSDPFKQAVANALATDEVGEIIVAEVNADWVDALLDPEGEGIAGLFNSSADA